MSIFAQLAAANGSSLTGPFGETITYTPFGGADIQLQALIERQAPVLTGATPRGQVSKLRVRIRKSDYPTRPNTSGDKVKASDMTTPATVQKVENEFDPVFWNLTVE